MSMLGSLSHNLLQLVSPERAHTIGKWAMKRRLLAPGPFVSSEITPATLSGWVLDNPLGLAAGFDKNGELVDVINDYGFGFIEVGSVTLKGGKGNPKPRLFRLPNGQLINRMGLNGEPAADVADRLSVAKAVNYGVSIAKSNDPELYGGRAITDICATYNYVKGFGLYTVINLSCPNTIDGKTFEEPEPLRDLLGQIRLQGKGRPLFVKFSPTLINDLERLSSLLQVCNDSQIDGYVVANTYPISNPTCGRGGLSGPTLFTSAVSMVQFIRKRFQDTNITIIGCGGIHNGAQVTIMLESGATLVQAYTGFVRSYNAGPSFAHNVLTEYLDHVELCR